MRYQKNWFGNPNIYFTQYEMYKFYIVNIYVQTQDLAKKFSLKIEYPEQYILIKKDDY